MPHVSIQIRENLLQMAEVDFLPPVGSTIKIVDDHEQELTLEVTGHVFDLTGDATIPQINTTGWEPPGEVQAFIG